MLHQMAVTTVSSMTKFYTKEFIGAALFEAVKFCVPRPHRLLSPTELSLLSSLVTLVTAQPFSYLLWYLLRLLYDYSALLL